MTNSPKFSDFAFCDQVLTLLARRKYIVPTPVQAEGIPAILNKQDLLACAHTGSGKTATYCLPFIDTLMRSELKEPEPHYPTGIIMVPTRELAEQVFSSINSYGYKAKLRVASIFGGVPYSMQTKRLKRGVHIVVGTPGRIADLIDGGTLKLDKIEYFVLDEVDRMLDMGFLGAIEDISAKTPDSKQSIFLSATLPDRVEKLATKILHEPTVVKLSEDQLTVKNIAQYVVFFNEDDKIKLLAKWLKREEFKHSVIFVRTKRGSEDLRHQLKTAGLKVTALHGDLDQGDRKKRLMMFTKKKYDYLVATDVAARGLNINDLTHVINFNLPDCAEDYVHRIGRTARAGKSGVAYSFCTPEEKIALERIEQLVKEKLTIATENQFHSVTAEVIGTDKATKRFRKNSRAYRKANRNPIMAALTEAEDNEQIVLTKKKPKKTKKQKAAKAKKKNKRK